jgi:hypothetical protein
MVVQFRLDSVSIQSKTKTYLENARFTITTSVSYLSSSGLELSFGCLVIILWLSYGYLMVALWLPCGCQVSYYLVLSQKEEDKKRQEGKDTCPLLSTCPVLSCPGRSCPVLSCLMIVLPCDCDCLVSDCDCLVIVIVLSSDCDCLFLSVIVIVL